MYASKSQRTDWESDLMSVRKWHVFLSCSVCLHYVVWECDICGVLADVVLWLVQLTVAAPTASRHRCPSCTGASWFARCSTPQLRHKLFFRYLLCDWFRLNLSPKSGWHWFNIHWCELIFHCWDDVGRMPAAEFGWGDLDNWTAGLLNIILLVSR